MTKVVIIGGGASGLVSALSASQLNKQVILLEKNEKLGKKIYITGKGRCNVTNNVEPNEFLQNVTTNPKFLYSSIFTFTSNDLINLLQDNGLELVTERGNRVFPKSYKASDVTKTFEKLLLKNNVDIRLNTEVEDILTQDNKVIGVLTDKGKILCDSVIVCTGGLSYPSTGSTGDGYTFAKRLGHSITSIKPSLCGLELTGNDFIKAQGLTLKNVLLKAVLHNKTLYSDFGELLFTHFGISGPIVLSCSSVINKYDVRNIDIIIDLKPALDVQTLDRRILNEFTTNPAKDIKNILRSLLPQSLIEIVLSNAKIPYYKKPSEITKEERERLIFTLKNLSFKIKSLRNIDEAIVTSGGVCVKEINAKTMESKVVKGLFFAGEVIDVDAYTGGFNLQIAFSTGFVAGKFA